MSIDEQPMNVYWSGKRTETSNSFKTNYKGSVATKSNLPSLGNKTGDMYNVIESGENFIWNGNSWDSLSGDTLKTLNWQKSEKASAVAFYPVSETILKPTVDFLFTEVSPVSGDKGPNNPSVITGVSNVNIGRVGKNLYNVFSSTIQSSRLPLPDNNGWIIASGDKTTYGTRYPGYYNTASSAIKSNKTYTLIVEIESISNCSIQYTINSSYEQRSQLNTGSKTLDSAGTHFIVCSNNNLYDPNCVVRTLVTAPENGQFSIKFRTSVYEGVVDASNFKYEPYIGNDYTIGLGSTYYGGTVDFATGILTMTWWGHIFDGTEAISAFTVLGTNSRVSYYNGIRALNQSQQACSHLSLLHDYTSDTPDFYVSTTETGGMSFFVPQTTQTAYKQWLADQIVTGSPFTVVCKLHTPVVSQLTPMQVYSLSQVDLYTPHINTVYSDQTSVQVGYAKSPIRSEYELAQAIAAIEGSE